MSVEKGTSNLLRHNQQHDRSLVGSQGLNNEKEIADDKELRLTKAAEEAGQHSVAHTVAPPAHQGAEEFHG